MDCKDWGKKKEKFGKGADCKEKVKQKKSAGKGADYKIYVKRQRSFGKEDFYENEVKRRGKSGKAELCGDSVKQQQAAAGGIRWEATASARGEEADDNTRQATRERQGKTSKRGTVAEPQGTRQVVPEEENDNRRRK